MAKHVISATSSAKLGKVSGSGLHFTSTPGLGSAKRAMENLGIYGTMNPSDDMVIDKAATDYAFGLEQRSADKAMAFEKDMSDTAHQREVSDLKAAGLNPVLSAGGSGASTATGQTANADTVTAKQEMANQKAMNKYAADKSYKANKYSVDQNIKFNKWATKYNGAVSDLVSARNLQAANTQAAATVSAANASAAAAKYSADMNYKTTLVSYDKQLEIKQYELDNGQMKLDIKGPFGAGYSISGPKKEVEAFSVFLQKGGSKTNIIEEGKRRGLRTSVYGN